jgi:hypothetical protein
VLLTEHNSPFGKPVMALREKGRIEMTVSEAALVGVFCMSLVFGILAVLYFLIRIFTVGIRKFESGRTEKTDHR